MKEMVVWPVQLEVFLDELGAIAIDGVHLFDGIRLGRASRYQSVDLVIAGSISALAAGPLAGPRKTDS